MEILIVIAGLLGIVGYYLFHTMQDMKIKRAERAVQTGDLDTALSIFMDSLKKNPNDIDALWHLGNINEEKNQYPEAIGYYSKLLEIGRESKFFSLYELYRRVGLLYAAIGRDQDALDFLMQAYNIVQSTKDVLETIATIIFTQKYFHRAIPYFEKGYQYLKKKPDFLKKYGFCQVMAERFTESIGTLEESIRYDAHDYQARFILAYTYYRIGALQKSREMLEEIVNSERLSLNSEQLYYAIKILFLIYLENKNFDISRELVVQLQKLTTTNLKNLSMSEEINMAYIFFRVQQGYYDLALESISKNIKFKDNVEDLSDDEKQKIKENSSYLYELVSSLDRFKKEHEKSMLSGPKAKQEFDFSILETKAQTSAKELATMFAEWKEKFIPAEKLWEFFAPTRKTEFDPTVILDKYAEESMQSLRKKAPQPLPGAKEEKPLEKDEEDLCEEFLAADFPHFLEMSMKLVENMGYKVINQAVKIDPLAYSEGRAIDILCEEKYQRDSRVLFCVRRWKEPIGYLSIQPVVQSLKKLEASRLVIVSSSDMSSEASRAIEGNPNIQFFLCNDIANQFLD